MEEIIDGSLSKALTISCSQQGRLCFAQPLFVPRPERVH